MLKRKEGLECIGGAVFDFLVIDMPRRCSRIFWSRRGTREGLGEGGQFVRGGS